MALVLLSACGDGKFHYVADSSSNTYFKVPKGWKKFNQDELVGAELAAARNANQPPSLIDVLVNREFQWRVAFDGDPAPSVGHTLTLAQEPVVEVSVRELAPEERQQVSLAALRNVIIDYDDQKVRSQQAGTGVGINTPATTSFRAIDEEELNLPDGVRGVRLRYVLRPNASSVFYAFDQTTLVDARAERLYVLLIRSGESQFLRYNGLFDEIARSFTVKAKG